ncbi:MAG TPA: lysylphosphatidylglycerol synthase domain-containing protein [Rhizobacter sp.]
MASELTHGRTGQRTPLTRRPWWPALKRTASALFFALVLWLIVRHARTVQWGEVWQSITDYPATTLALAALLAAASHALYASFDLVSRRYAGHQLPTARVLATTFVSYAFNLNFGALVGGLAFRIRLYTRQGLDAATISRVYGLSMVTNWLGYFVLAGAVCLLQPIPVPEAWSLGSDALRALGLALLAVPLVYLGLCSFSRRRSVTVRGHALRLPSGRMAALQLALSTLNWALIGATVYVLLQPQVEYPAALAALLAAAVAGVVTHVPAGLGVLEAVFLALLSASIAQSPLLAALLVYRALYYLLPLALAALVFLGLELRLKPSASRRARA